MRERNSKASGTPRLRDVLKEDFKQKGHIGASQKEWKELQEFYLTEDQKERLRRMSNVESWLWKVGWILKSMFLRLSPFRRVLVVVATIFILPTFRVSDASDSFSLNFPVGSILLIVVILLELKDKLLAKDELQAGRKIQHALMPEQYPQVDGWQIMLFTRSANEVGGDLVDFLRIDPNRVSISLADISGKGLHAALLMSKLQSTIRALASDEMPIDKLVMRVNDIFHRDTPPSIFASLLYTEIAPSSDEVNFINAGHFPPLIFQENKLQNIPKGGLGLGLKDGTEYSSSSIQLKKGDIFIGYSDGITEARNNRGDFYGLDRLTSLLQSLVELPAEQVGKKILHDIDNFVGEASTNDDMSLVILKRD